MKISLRLLIAFIAVTAVTIAIGPSTRSAQAQSPCKSFDAIGQMLIPTSQPLAVGHKWGGQIYIKMDDAYLQGLISGEDGTVVRTPNTGHGKDGLYIVGFN